MMRLSWHNYQYYPYERELALREAAELLSASPVIDNEGVQLHDYRDPARARHLTYFAGYMNGHGYMETVQARLENAVRTSTKRQSTRYSVHGLHEYKGKFNPQIARAVLNIFNVRSSQRVIDPFCGSGTTLVECAHLGVAGHGTDINPFAVYLANAKLLALRTPVIKLQTILDKLSIRFRKTKRWATAIPDDARSTYLRAWFDPDILQVIEILAGEVMEVAGEFECIFLGIASNLLRDYSLQDPQDLRIRRRTSPIPDVSFIETFLTASERFLERLAATQSVIGIKKQSGTAVLCDITDLKQKKYTRYFDMALTSPPYAMALPYIDTQRLSLVWLNLLPPSRVLGLESELIGSREFRGSRRDFMTALRENSAAIPDSDAFFCTELQAALGERDGFRRQAVPTLLYRYFASMQASFKSIRSVMKPGAPFALVIGHNHTILGGKRYDINTPAHLASVAQNTGWIIDELIELQTYRRYGYHVNNAVGSETLLILKNQ